MYTPSRSFLRELKHLDRNLGCKYEPGHEHFVITYNRPHGGDVPIMLIEGMEGEFRYPNMRDIQTLQQADTHRVPLKERMQKNAFYFEETRRKQRERSRDEFRQRTLEDRRQLMPRFAKMANEAGKHNSTFRRVELKQRGKTIEQIQRGA